MATTSRRLRRSPEDWEQIAREIRPQLQAGTPLSKLQEQFGSNTYAAQVALARIGSDPRGNDLRLRPITGSRPKTIAKRIAERRAAGEAFWQIEAEVDPHMSYREIKELLREHGYGEYASGRVPRNGTDAAADDPA